MLVAPYLYAKPLSEDRIEFDLVGLIMHRLSFDGLANCARVHASKIRGADFQDVRLGKIFDAVMDAYEKGEGRQFTDLFLKVPQECRQMLSQVDDTDRGGALALNIDWVISEFKKVRWRSAAKSALKAVDGELGHGADVEKAREKLSAALNVVIETAPQVSHSVGSGELVDRLQALIEERVLAHRSGEPLGISTGLKLLDRSFYGWMRQMFAVVAARPGVGKTTFACNVAVNAARQGKHVLFFTNEMPAEQIGTKMLGMITGVLDSRIRTGALEEQHLDALAEGLREYNQLPITVNDKDGRYLETFIAECEHRKRMKCLDFVIMDYVQQLYLRDKKIPVRHQELTEITGRIKAMVNSLEIPVLCLAQLNREAERDKGKPPTKAHLKDSGSIEQDADLILMLWRDTDVAKKDRLWTSIVKNRFGPEGDVELKIDLTRSRFYDA